MRVRRRVLVLLIVTILVRGGASSAQAAPAPPTRPLALPFLYGSFVALQAADSWTTLRAARYGNREGNPLLNGFGSHGAGLVGSKLVATAGTIYISERLWKKNRVAAVVLMVCVNAAYAAVVRRNFETQEPRGATW